MDRSWLIQRSSFRYLPERIGIDKIISMDYMGSAEFENWGSNPHKASLDRIRENLDEYSYNNLSVLGNRQIIVFCKKSDYPEVVNRIFGLSKGEMKLKEYCDLSNWVKGEEDRSDHWWDIDNDFMFWKNSCTSGMNEEKKKLLKKFTGRFKELIQPPQDEEIKKTHNKMVDILSRFIPRKFLTNKQ